MPTSREQNDAAAAHAEFFATHGFTAIGHSNDTHGGPGPSDGPAGLRGSFGRASHGSVRAIVLWALAEGPMHGYQIMTTVEQRSEGFWKLSPGSVYPVLAQLEDEQLVTCSAGEGRRTYTLTETGRHLADSIREGHGPAPWLAAKDLGERRFRLWRAISDLADTVREVALNGSQAEAEQVVDLLEEATERTRAITAARTTQAQ